mgnify:CR=1 FL=1
MMLIVTGLFGRSILEYKYTLDYLQGKVPLSEDVKNVLLFYYTDMLNFLSNNKIKYAIVITLQGFTCKSNVLSK